MGASSSTSTSFHSSSSTVDLCWRRARASFSLDDPQISLSVLSGLTAGSLSLLSSRRFFSLLSCTLHFSSGSSPLRSYPCAALFTYASGCIACHSFCLASGHAFRSSALSRRSKSHSENERLFVFRDVPPLWPIPGLPDLYSVLSSLSSSSSSFSLIFNAQPLFATDSSRNRAGIVCGLLTLLCAAFPNGPRSWLTILPSSLFHRGSFARRWLVASSADYADALQKRNLHLIGQRYGCHSCGIKLSVAKQQWRALLRANPSESEGLMRNLKMKTSKEEPVIGYVGDHIPPSALNAKAKRKKEQIFLPQCPSCSSLQSVAVRNKRPTLVMQHWSRLTWQDLFLPFPLLVVPFSPLFPLWISHFSAFIFSLSS